MNKTILTFTEAGKNIFSPATGYNFRIRDNDGAFYSIKPSTRPRGVKGEYGFETYNPNKMDVKIGVDIPEGEYGLESLKYGWLKLTPVSENAPLAVTACRIADASETANNEPNNTTETTK